MNAGEETGGSANLKRQREPLSDSEDNIVSAPEMKDGLKRRRLEAAGQENCTLKPSTSGRLAELLTKPDTPIIPSVRSRVQLLTQRGNAQRSHSDPGAEDRPVLNKGFQEHFLGKDEFKQRVECFKAPLSTTSPTPIQSPATPCQRTGSNFVSGIQQKLQCTTTPSSKQASLIRQEREMELNLLPFQPISKNTWLKRSSSDSSINQQAHGDAEMRDGSFIEALASAAEKPSVNMMGEGTSSQAPASAEFEFFSEGHKQKPHHGEEDENKKEHKSAPTNKEEQPGFQHLETQAVLKLPFSEEHSLSELHKADKHCFLQPSLLDESNMKEASEDSEVDISEGFTFGEGETMDNSSYGEVLIEPSTDEELRIWRYPQSRAEESVIAEEKQVFTKEMEGVSKSPRENKEKEDGSTNDQNLTHIQDVEFSSSADVSSEIAGFSKQQEGEKPEMGGSIDNSEEGKSDLNSNKEKAESSEDCCEEMTTQNDTFQQSQESQTVCVKYEAHALEETQSGNTDHGRNARDVDLPSGKSQTCGNGRAQSSTDVHVSDSHEMETSSTDGGQDVDGLTETHKTESSRKVTFILEPELINSSTLTESDTSMESRTETSLSDAGLSSHDETNTSETIDKMFEEVLECAGGVEKKEQLDEETEDHDSGIGACSEVKDRMDPDVEKKRTVNEDEDECEESRNLDSTGDELLTFPANGILSPLSKSVEAAVTPLRLAATQKFDPPSFLLTQEDPSVPPAESAPLYSVDAYRTQRQSKLLTVRSITPAVQRQTPEMTKPQPSVNTKETIAALNEEASKLQTVINQTLQALSCCTDEEHGRGSLEEAEAEKLLLVSCEKRSALLAEVARLREARSSESEEATKEGRESISQQPCRGTVSITNIQLPLKVEFVCSSQNHTGRPTHYFFVLIRYGPCNIIATPLATVADAQYGDAISFPTSVTMKDIRASFEIDVEVYSLSRTSGISSTTDRASTKSRVTPRKLLNTITKSSNTLTCSASANARRSSNFCLVGSHKITLTSLGHNKFPLDKMKFEGKIRKLLGDEFQDKVPFLSPLEGNIYLKLASEGHSDVQHQGFLTMFELISGFGVWNRQYFVLEGCNMYYWNHPNEKETKEAAGSVSLSNFPNQCVRPVKREACARPFTFELVEKVPQLEDQNQEPLSKCWFSADTKQDRLDWMEKLNQALLDFHTWKRPQPGSRQPNPSSSENLRESIL